MANEILQFSVIWDNILKELKTQIDEPKIFDAFISDSYLNNVDRDQMFVVVNSELASSLLSSKYIDIINRVVNEITQTNYKVIFITEEQAKNQTKKIVTVEKNLFFENSRLNPNQTFDNFIVGPCNREASQASLMIASNPGKMYNPLFIYSGSGLGKTHLLQAIGNYIRQNNPNKKVLYIQTTDFIDEFMKFIRGEQEAKDIRSFFDKEVDILLIDDIQFLGGKTRTGELFFDVFSKMINQNKQVIIVSDKHPEQLKDLEERLVSRFKQGLTVGIKQPDIETAKLILKSKIESSELSLDFFEEEVLDLISLKFNKNVRDLEMALNRIIFYTTNFKQVNKIDLEAATEALQNELNIRDAKTQLSINKIIDVVADYYNLSINQLVGKIRTNQIALPRHIAMYLSRTLLDASFSKIGQTFGGKDHSTVMNGVEKVEKELKSNTDLQKVISELKKKLKE